MHHKFAIFDQGRDPHRHLQLDAKGPRSNNEENLILSNDRGC